MKMCVTHITKCNTRKCTIHTVLHTKTYDTHGVTRENIQHVA